MSRTLLSLFEAQVARSPRRTALRFRSGGIWRSRTWSEWRETSRRFAAALAAWGIAPGDRVAILAHTSIRWVEADLGLLHAGAALVPIYPTLHADTVREILRDSGAKVLVAEDPVQLAKAFEGHPLPDLERAVLFEHASRLERPDAQGRLDVTVADVAPPGFAVVTFDEALELGAKRIASHPSELDERAAAVKPDSLAALYYTSGTSGEPKGVQLTHDNFVSEVEQLRDLMPVGVSDEQLLFLPLAHIVAKLTVMLQLEVGFVTSFAASLDSAAEDCTDVRPTFLVGVPRVYEKIQESIESSPTLEGEIQQRAFDWALAIGRRVSELRQKGGEPGALLAVQHRSAERLVFSRIKQGLGGRVRFMLSGAAPLSRDTAEFFHALGLLILEGFGLTETTGASTMNLPHRYRFGSVGAALPGVLVKLAEDGEILLKGRSVTPGYWNRAEDTKSAFTDDGFFRTGDIGVLDRDGFLTITDRKKDLIITAGGKNVAPQRVAAHLTASPYIERAVVIGDRRKFPVALLVLSNEAIHRWADEHGLGGDSSALIRHPKVRALIAEEVQKGNARLASFESIKRFEILAADLSVEGGDLTPTGKIKRRVIAKKHADIIDALYEGVTTELEDLA